MNLPSEVIGLYQRDIRYPLPYPEEKEFTFLLQHARKTQTFIFSEYAGFHAMLKHRQEFYWESERTLAWLKYFSALLKDTLIIGGSFLLSKNNHIYNACPFLFQGEVLGYYYKQNPYGKEKEFLSKGTDIFMMNHPVTKSVWSCLICYDVLLPGIFGKLQKANFIAIPTNSPRRKESEQDRQNRDKEIYVQGAKESQAMLFKCCSVGQVGRDWPRKCIPGLKKAPRLQGRSLIASQDKVLWKAKHIDWTGISILNTKTKEITTYEWISDNVL